MKSRIFLSTKLRFTVMASLPALFILASAGLSAAQYDQTGPWWAKLPRPLLGMAYTPEPSDYNNPGNNCTNDPSTCKYFDDDFFNADFEELWGSTGTNARNDLATIAGMGMNFLHLYDFSPCRNHVAFIQYANSLKLSVMIPISNYFVSGADPNEQQDIQTLFNEIYQVGTPNQGIPLAGAVIWDIGNEYDYNDIPAANVANVVNTIVNLENGIGVTDANKLLFTSPVSFANYGSAPGIVQLKRLKKAFIAAGLKDLWYTRFVASINPFNSGTFMANYLNVTYPENMSTKDTTLPLFFSEFGQDAPDACGQLHPNHPHSKCATTAQQNAAQATFETRQIDKVLPIAQSPSDSQTGYFYGFSIFQWQNEFFLTGTQATWGVLEQGTPPTGNGTIIGGVCGIPSNTFTYPIDPLNDKPNFTAIVDAIK